MLSYGVSQQGKVQGRQGNRYYIQSVSAIRPPPPLMPIRLYVAGLDSEIWSVGRRSVIDRKSKERHSPSKQGRAGHARASPHSRSRLFCEGACLRRSVCPSRPLPSSTDGEEDDEDVVVSLRGPQWRHSAFWSRGGEAAGGRADAGGRDMA